MVHRGVYAVGHAALTRQGRWIAALLAVGPGAVLSHRSAAELWRLGPREGAGVDISINRARARRKGIVVHRSALGPDEITIVDGIPVTTVARTLLDLAAELTRRQLERALHEADIQRLWDVTGLRALMDRYPSRRGTRTLRAIFAANYLGAPTRNDFEARFLVSLVDNALPRPLVNHQVPTVGECDFVWPDQRLIVELDGYATHGTRHCFEADRARDRALQVAGWRVIRITWLQLRDEPRQLAADLRGLLQPHH